MTSERSAPANAAATHVDVHEAGPAEIVAAGRLVLAGLAEHWGSVDASLNHDLANLAAAYPTGRTLVAVDHVGRVVGTGTVVPRDDHDVEVVRMAVAAELRGTGVGRRILDALIDIASGWGAQRVVLETTAAWTATVAFYERCGFRVTRYVDGDFGRDAWFERRLGEPGSGPA